VSATIATVAVSALVAIAGLVMAGLQVATLRRCPWANTTGGGDPGQAAENRYETWQTFGRGVFLVLCGATGIVVSCYHQSTLGWVMIAVCVVAGIWVNAAWIKHKRQRVA
jgi:hypothetical protein